MAPTPKRFIPTGVGNTPCRLVNRYLYPVHPHWRGEHEKPNIKSAIPYGSSPLAWGTQCDNAL